MAYYVDSKPSQPQDQTIRVAVSKYRKGQWRTPHGYNGITSKSIAEKEKAYEEEKKIMYKQEAEAYKNIVKEASNREVAKGHLAELMKFLKPTYLKTGENCE